MAKTKIQGCANIENISKIIRRFYPPETPRENRWIDTKSGWLKYSHAVQQENLLNKIRDTLNVSASYIDDGPQYRTNFTVVDGYKGSKIEWRTEEALERFIVASNDNKIANQYNISSLRDKEAIDLVDTQISTIIELKPWKSKNSPIYGFLELLKNYVLIGKQKVIKNLILLAPEEYFEEYYQESSVSEFLKTVRVFRENNKELRFQIKYLQIKYAEFEAAIKSVRDASNLDWRREARSPKFARRAMIKEGYKVPLEIRQKLLVKHWKSISSIDDWPQGR